MSRVVLLTGSNGFVGRQVLKSLKKSGVCVRLVMREGVELPANFDTDIDSAIRTPDLFAEPESWWSKVCEGIDTILHMAWYAEPGKYLQSTRNTDCLNGTMKLANACIRAGVRRFVGIGTCFEYDLTSKFLSKHTPLKPLTPYAEAKATVYQGLLEYLPEQNVEFAWCRLFFLYGEGEDDRRLVPYIRAKLSMGENAYLTRGNQIRDYMDVKEAGKMIAEVVLNDTQGPINICSGIGVSIRQFAEKIADEYGSRDLLIFGARPDNTFDPPRVVGLK